MEKSWRAMAVSAAVAFTATFVGVFVAQYLSAVTERRAELRNFNSLYRIMAKDCEQSLVAVRDNRPLDRPTYLLQPTFLRFSLQEHAVVLNELDEERMTRLIEQIARVDSIANQYGDAAYRYDALFPVHIGDPGPPALPPQAATQEVRDQYESNMFEYQQWRGAMDRDLAGLKSLYARYEDEILATCKIFSETVQRN